MPTIVERYKAINARIYGLLVDDLKALCRKFDLPVSGRKNQLIDRLKELIQKNEYAMDEGFLNRFESEMPVSSRFNSASKSRNVEETPSSMTSSHQNDYVDRLLSGSVSDRDTYKNCLCGQPLSRVGSLVRCASIHCLTSVHASCIGYRPTSPLTDFSWRCPRCRCSSTMPSCYVHRFVGPPISLGGPGRQRKVPSPVISRVDFELGALELQVLPKGMSGIPQERLWEQKLLPRARASLRIFCFTTAEPMAPACLWPRCDLAINGNRIVVPVAVEQASAPVLDATSFQQKRMVVSVTTQGALSLLPASPQLSSVPIGHPLFRRLEELPTANFALVVAVVKQLDLQELIVRSLLHRCLNINFSRMFLLLVLGLQRRPGGAWRGVHKSSLSALRPLWETYCANVASSHAGANLPILGLSSGSHGNGINYAALPPDTDTKQIIIGSGMRTKLPNCSEAPFQEISKLTALSASKSLNDETEHSEVPQYPTHMVYREGMSGTTFFPFEIPERGYISSLFHFLSPDPNGTSINVPDSAVRAYPLRAAPPPKHAHVDEKSESVIKQGPHEIPLLSPAAILGNSSKPGPAPTSSSTEVADDEDLIELEHFNPDSTEPEIPSQSQLISLIDPFSHQLIRIPARGDACEHVQCIDLFTYLRTNTQSPSAKWVCPLCKSPMKPYQIWVDSFVLLIMISLQAGISAAEGARGDATMWNALEAFKSRNTGMSNRSPFFGSIPGITSTHNPPFPGSGNDFNGTKIGPFCVSKRGIDLPDSYRGVKIEVFSSGGWRLADGLNAQELNAADVVDLLDSDGAQESSSSSSSDSEDEMPTFRRKIDSLNSGQLEAISKGGTDQVRQISAQATAPLETSTVSKNSPIDNNSNSNNLVNSTTSTNNKTTSGNQATTANLPAPGNRMILSGRSNSVGSLPRPPPPPQFPFAPSHVNSNTSSIPHSQQINPLPIPPMMRYPVVPAPSNIRNNPPPTYPGNSSFSNTPPSMSTNPNVLGSPTPTAPRGTVPGITTSPSITSGAAGLRLVFSGVRRPTAPPPGPNQLATSSSWPGDRGIDQVNKRPRTELPGFPSPVLTPHTRSSNVNNNNNSNGNNGNPNASQNPSMGMENLSPGNLSPLLNADFQVSDYMDYLQEFISSARNHNDAPTSNAPITSTAAGRSTSRPPVEFEDLSHL